MGITIKTFVGGPLETNAYLVIDDSSGEALVIDAPFDVVAEVVQAATDAGASIKTIVVTHGHWDHIGDLAALKEQTGAPVLASELSRERLIDPGSSVMPLPSEIIAVEPDSLIGEGDTVPLGDEVFEVLHLPGHEPGHIVLYSAEHKTFLGGDVLFPNGHGRIDIPGA